MSEQLRPCPFCKSVDVYVEIDGACGVFYVECGTCMAHGPMYSTKRKFGKNWPKDAAIRAWNGDVYMTDKVA